jgi:thiamine-monophosphate kinase
MRESELHKLIYRRSTELGPRVRIGPGDDAAMVAAGPDGRVLITVDQMIEGRHFVGALTAESQLDGVARKAVARSVSDIAAMAGSPTWALATAALPPEVPQPFANLLFERMAYWARHWRCPLVGGDIAAMSAGGPLMLTVTVGGDPHARRGAVLRSGAKAGDRVWVTGRIGGSLVSRRHLTFEPRVREAAWLAETLGDRLHAMIDVSDGVGIDASRVAAASGVEIEISAASVPVHPEATATALADGEDYELLFTTAAEVERLEACPKTGTEMTAIGVVREGSGCFVLERSGQRIDASTMGWDH